MLNSPHIGFRERVRAQDFVVSGTRWSAWRDHRANKGNTRILLGQLEIADLKIRVTNVGPLDPDRWVLGGLGFDSANRKVPRIHPDQASVEKLSGHLAQPRQNFSALETCDIKNFVPDTICGVEAALVSLVHALENLIPRGRKSMFASR